MDDVSARDGLAERLRAVALRDRGALRDVYDRTAAKLFGICLRILPAREEAEEVLQEVYLTVWEKAGAYDSRRASPITWLAAIARNKAIDRLRSLGPRAREQPLPDDDVIRDEAPDALGRLERSDEHRRLRDCLDALETRTREAIAAAFFGGHTYEALAVRMNVPLGTMKTWIRRGLLSLRGCLEP